MHYVQPYIISFSFLYTTIQYLIIFFPILAPDIRPPPPTLLTGILEPPPPPPGVEPDQDDIGIKFKSFDLNKVEHEPPRTLAGYEAEVNVWPIFKFTYMKIVSIMIFYINLHIGQITLTLVLGILVNFFVKEGPYKKAKKTMFSLGSFFLFI